MIYNQRSSKKKVSTFVSLMAIVLNFLLVDVFVSLLCIRLFSLVSILCFDISILL
jgi:hypothetical protein